MNERPRLREGLVVRRLGTDEHPYVMVKDPSDGRIFQFEEWEDELLSLIDGTRDVHEIAASFATRRPDKALDVQGVADYVESLRLTGILERTEQETQLVMMDKLKTLRRRRFGRQASGDRPMPSALRCSP